MGLFRDRPPPGTPTIMRTQVTDMVQEAIVRSLQWSKRKLLQAVGISQTTVQPTLHMDLFSNIQAGSCALTTNDTNACITFFH
jgi:hypothetical protein